MDRRRAAAALLALVACFACSTAAPTATDHTALELVDGRTEGCYYNFQHYGEGDRIMTNEPCLNCTCHNRMLMCYLRVCPFTKAIGQDCTVEKRADQCCPIVTCPDVPVDLLTSTSTLSPAEYGATGLGKQDKYGCSINGKYFSEGSKVPPTPNKPCEHCYCIRNMTTCVMQECTLHVDGCTPIYHKDVCCPVRYSCDHLEDEIPLLDDMTTTVRPTPGFLLTTTTTMTPVTQASQDCIHEDQVFRDGAHIKTEKACEHCYCMKGDIVCVVQGCGTPMENEGKNCTALPLRPGQCCPDTYICEGDEYNVDITTEVVDQSTMPPRRVGIEGSGYRNEPDEPFKDMGTLETDVEGSGDEYITSNPIDIESSTIDEKPSEGEDKILATTPHQDIPVSQHTESEKEENDINVVDTNEGSSVIPEQNIISYTTETSSEFVYTPKEIKTTISEDDQNINEFTSIKEDLFTTESVFRKEDNNAASDTLLHEEEKKVTASPGYLTEETPFKEPEFTGSTELIMESAYDKEVTTQSTKYISDNMDTTKHRDDMFDSQTESAYTDKQSEDNLLPETIIDKELPTTSSHVTEETINLSEVQTTTVDSIYNEINENDDDSNKPARIPGEGDCLLNGVTYNNNTNVPRSNNCHTSCKCVSSIIKCDPIICSPPPEYIENMNDCQPIYDSPDSCCPTYVCSAKETIPPQSHSQMSGTEGPRPIENVECNDSGNCELEQVEKQPDIPETPCLSDDCENKSKNPEQSICESKECGESAATVPPKLKDCFDGNCQVPPVKACEGENCKNDASEKPIEVDNSSDNELHVNDSSICSDKEGCPVAVDSLQKECANETCRRRDEPKLENELNLDCSGVECKTAIDVALTTKSDVDHSMNIVTEQSTLTIETATNGAVVKEEETDQSLQEQTEINDIPASTESEEATDKLISTENESATSLPTQHTLSDITETENIKPIDEQSTTDAAVESQKTYSDEVTEKMYVEKVDEKEKIPTEKEPSYTESSQSVDLPSEQVTEKVHLLTTESISDDNDSGIDKTNLDTIYTVLPTLDGHKITKAPEITEPEISTPVQFTLTTQSSTIGHKPTDISKISDIPKSEKTDLFEEEEGLIRSTTVPIDIIDKNEEIHGSLAITTDLPKSEFIDEPHHETPITDIEKDTSDLLHTTPELEEPSTNIHEQTNILTNLRPTESVGSQNEVTEQTDVENPHETVIADKLDTEPQFITDKPKVITDNLDTEQQSITDHPEVTNTDKLDSEEQFVTDKLEIITEKLDTEIHSITYQPEVTSSKDIPQVSTVDDVSDNNMSSTDASQLHSFKYEITTKSYYDVTEGNIQYNELSKYSTPQTFENIPDTEDKEKDDKLSDGKDFTTISLEEEENLPVVTESIVSYTIQPEIKLNEVIKTTDVPVSEEEYTEVPDTSIGISDGNSGAPDIEVSKIDDSDIPKKQDPSIQFPEVPVLGDNDEIKLAMVTEVPSDSSLSTQTIITSPGSLQDMTYEIEKDKPKESEKELNILDNTLDLSTIKDNKQFTEDMEIVTEPITKYTVNEEQDFQITTISNLYEKEGDQQTEIHGQSTTLQDNLNIQESSTNPEDKNIQTQMIPDISDTEPKDQFTEVEENKLTTAQFDITKEVLKEEELLTEKDQNTEKYSPESHEMNTAAIEDVGTHLGTTSTYIIDEEEYKPTDVQDLFEKSTSSPHIDQTNNEQEIESSTSFDELETSKKIEDPTESLNIVTEKVSTLSEEDFDTNKLQTLADENVSKTTTKESLIEELYPSHSTYEPTQTEANSEQLPTQTAKVTKEKDIEETQGNNNSVIPEILETEKVTTDNVLISQHIGSKLPEHSPEEDEKLDESKNKLAEPEETTHSEISPTVLISEQDNVVTEAAHALVTNYFYTGGSDEAEKEIETATIKDVSFTTQSQEQASETPEHVDQFPEILNEISHDVSVTLANPEKVTTEHPYTTTVSLSYGVDVEEQNIVTQSIEEQSDKSETPTNVIPVSQQSESITENIFASTSSQREEEEVLYEEEKKPVTESIILDEKNSKLPSEHYVPVFVQGTEFTPEVSTISANIIDTETDQDFKINDFTSTKPQKLFTIETIATDSVTEVYEKEKSSERVVTDITTEISKISMPEEVFANAPAVTVEPEKSTETAYSKISEITESERITTEIYISPEEEFSTPSVLEIIPEEKETLKPLSDAETTEGTYDSVAEKKPSDVSTELPVEILTDTNEVSTSSLQEEYTTSADRFIEKDVTAAPELISGDIDDKTGSKISEIDDLTSPVPIHKETLSEKDNNISSSELSVPTEPTLPQKEVPVETTEYVEKDISDLNIPISTEENKNQKEVTHIESTYSETTPFSVELEEHTHSLVYDSSTILPSSEISMEINEPHEPERGDLGEIEEPIKPTERLPLDFEHKEKPETSINDLTNQNVESTITPLKLDNEIVSITDQPSIPTEEPIRRTQTTQIEELITSSSEQTINEVESTTTEQPITTPTSPVISTERDIPITSEKPLQHEQTQSIKDSETEVTDKLLQHITTGKYEENIQTDSPIDKLPDEILSSASPSSPIPELSKPVFNEEPVEDIPSPDFPPSGTGGYGQEPDYVEEDQAFGPGTCRYGGKVYVSAQQIPRDDPCDFCFCFRSDIICLQQSCPPPIHGCHEEPIQGFCCPRYECPVSMATTLNMTTTTTTTTTTLPPHFLPHAYKGAAQRRGCQIKGHTYKVGEVVRASSGPCLHCTCGGDGQMKCDPKACTPEPMLRQMIAAAVSAKRRR